MAVTLVIMCPMNTYHEVKVDATEGGVLMSLCWNASVIKVSRHMCSNILKRRLGSSLKQLCTTVKKFHYSVSHDSRSVIE